MASALPMLGRDYLNHVWKGTGGKLKALVRPLLKDGIGDRMDKGNLYVFLTNSLIKFSLILNSIIDGSFLGSRYWFSRYCGPLNCKFYASKLICSSLKKQLHYLFINAVHKIKGQLIMINNIVISFICLVRLVRIAISYKDK